MHMNICLPSHKFHPNFSYLFWNSFEWSRPAELAEFDASVDHRCTTFHPSWMHFCILCTTIIFSTPPIIQTGKIWQWKKAFNFSSLPSSPSQLLECEFDTHIKKYRSLAPSTHLHSVIASSRQGPHMTWKVTSSSKWVGEPDYSIECLYTLTPSLTHLQKGEKKECDLQPCAEEDLTDFGFHFYLLVVGMMIMVSMLHFGQG